MPPLLSRVLETTRRGALMRRLGTLASLTVFGVACIVLYRALGEIDPTKVIAAIRATPLMNIAAAAGFVVAGYFTLTFYDLFALWTIGRRDIPYRVAALAGFTSYSVGHNVGASIFSGGAVRYRIYSRWGLDAIDVARLCFVAGLTFWLGNVAVLGLGVAVHPEAARAIDQLPLIVNRAVAIAALMALAVYIGWVASGHRYVGRGPWRVALPGGWLTLVQIAIGIVDLGCCAIAMHMLLPQAPAIGLPTVAVIFVAATLMGFASHSPGGLGVFDAAMVLGLAQFDRAELVASLLLFRLLYYLLPFMVALAILGIYELRGRANHGGSVKLPEKDAPHEVSRVRGAREAQQSSD